MEPTNGSDGPITLKDLIEALTEAEARIEDRIVQALDGRMRELETKLLTAFHGATERTDQRMKRLEAAETTTVARLSSLEAEGRFTALELRVIETEKYLRETQLRLRKLEDRK
jgi:hypothetical protein